MGIPPRTLYRYRRDFPDQVPKSFDLKSWIKFIGAIKNYSAERTRPRDRNGIEPSAEDRNGEYTEYTAGAEGKERILRLRLSNELRRTSLQQLCQSRITVAEFVEALDRVKRVAAADLLRLPASLCHELVNRGPEHIQQVLDAAVRSSLERLSQSENYL